MSFKALIDIELESAINQSGNILREAIPDLSNLPKLYDSVSDSFLIESSDTTVLLALPTEAKFVLDSLKTDTGRFKGVYTRTNQVVGCKATLGLTSFGGSLDTLTLVVSRSSSILDTIGFDITEKCPEYLVFAANPVLSPRFVYVNGKYERLGINTTNR